MRLGRWLILTAIITIVVFVANTYLKRKATLDSDAPTPPRPLELGVQGRANDWCFTQSDGDKPRVKVCAQSYREIKEPSSMELGGVELWLYQKDATRYDLVKSAKAQFDIAGKSLYSDSDVEITLGMETDGPQHGRLLKINTSGVRFETSSGKATTDRPARFEFDQGGGSATGAEYDPNTRELHLRSQVTLDWRGKTPDSKPMHVEAGEAFYRERDSKVILLPWSRLTRDTMRMDAGMSVVTLQDGSIQNADVLMARGVQDDSGRKVEYGADHMWIDFGGDMLIRHIKGTPNARLVSTSSSARTTVTGDNLDLDFAPGDKQSALDDATASGKSVAESVPLPQPGAQAAETRILRSDVIRVKMRPGGREMERAETDGPATLDFLPNSPGQPKRNLKGDRIWIAYGKDNRIDSFRSVNVSTRTEKPAPAGKPAPPPSVTQSKEILASFDPVSGDLARVEQKTNFTYQEGDRQAHADRAVLDQKQDVMTLDGGARFWDPTGSVTADRVVMNQKSGGYTAEGHVSSSHQPDHGGKSSAMLSTDEVLQARAQRMTSTDQNRKIHYEGAAVAWQGANRVNADRLDIDRARGVLEAHGHAISQFEDKAKDGAKPAAAPVYTVVHAQDLTYTDDTRVAFYQGKVLLERPGLTVESKELHAYLKDADSDSSLDRAIADGAVKIVSVLAKSGGSPRTRIGTSDHAEYYADEGRVVLEKGAPLLVDNLRDNTTGKQLIWFANNDRLLVNGEENRPAQSTLRKTKK